MYWVLVAVLAGVTGQDAGPSRVTDAPRPAPRASHAAGNAARGVLRPVAVVNGTPLFSDRLESAVAALLPYESFHRNVSTDKLAELRRQALAGLVDDELQYQDA